ncbi:ubiquitin carboxyl-terminal hydrolase 8-like [Corticium candelabrum]|uniref:ubiquitin carboxyl-terminal hydrolase 8-like n=1 Tax=Corticium candelabrum TaxID=121492 RepID=UPI002E266F9D|nr:ubiquitin carboxyl-terminal hydrolase 8-like [Corticium candelabrum]
MVVCLFVRMSVHLFICQCITFLCCVVCYCLTRGTPVCLCVHFSVFYPSFSLAFPSTCPSNPEDIILITTRVRFSFKGVWRDKLNTDVSFPINGLNVNNYVVGPTKPGNYHLYGVSNHSGNLNGGHYTACCKSPFTGRWHTFDDKDVSEKSESNVRSSAAYILFYTSIDLRPTPTAMTR